MGSEIETETGKDAVPVTPKAFMYLRFATDRDLDGEASELQRAACQRISDKGWPLAGIYNDPEDEPWGAADCSEGAL